MRAWRHGPGLWGPFHAEVRRWLADWRPGAAHLVLIGPSGGYALSRPFLERFQRVSVLEPDPLARWLLRRGFPGLGFAFADSRPLAGPGGLAWLAARFPDAAFLFCNLLGQTLVGQGEGFERAAWLAQLAPALAGREWASWHDLASTRRPPDVEQSLTLPRAEPLDDLLARFWHGGELEIQDHECAGIAPDLPRSVAFWRLTPKRWHLVECLSSGSATIAPPPPLSTP